jgi:hypothetical protein
LNSAIEEMKHTFGYASFELMDTSITRTSSHSHSESSLTNPNTGYEIDYDNVSVSNDGKVVTVPRFSIRVAARVGRGPVAVGAGRGGRGAGGQASEGGQAADGYSSYLENEVVIHGDERLIVGKLRMPNGQGGDVFVILTAKAL